MSSLLLLRHLYSPYCPGKKYVLGTISYTKVISYFLRLALRLRGGKNDPNLLNQVAVPLLGGGGLQGRHGKGGGGGVDLQG